MAPDSSRATGAAKAVRKVSPDKLNPNPLNQGAAQESIRVAPKPPWESGRIRPQDLSRRGDARVRDPPVPPRPSAGPAPLPCLSKLAPLEHAVINGVFLSVLRGPHYVPLMLRFALSTVTELND